MLGNSKISYLKKLCHATTGCSGEGCPMKDRGCWAEGLVRDRLAGRMKGLPGLAKSCPGCDIPPNHPMCFISCVKSGVRDPFAPTFHPDLLKDPLRARKPQVIGMSFFGDWCDRGITREQRFKILNVAQKNELRQEPHTLIFLTKRSEELLATLSHNCIASFPLEHSWFGVSVTGPEDKHRIEALRHCPAKHRWVSAEPLHADIGALDLTDVSLVIAGGASGPKARPCALEWFDDAAVQCIAAGVQFWCKQLGSFVVSEDRAYITEEEAREEGFESRWRWRAGLRDRAGADSAEWPLNLRALHGDLPWSELLTKGER